MKRIGHFIDTEVIGGAEIIVLEICKRLPAYGFEPVIFHFKNELLRDRCNQYGIKQKTAFGYRRYKYVWTVSLPL